MLLSPQKTNQNSSRAVSSKDGNVSSLHGAAWNYFSKQDKAMLHWKSSALLSPLREPYSDYVKQGHKTTFKIIKGFASFEAGLWLRLKDFFLSLSLVKPFSKGCCRKKHKKEFWV